MQCSFFKSKIRSILTKFVPDVTHIQISYNANWNILYFEWQTIQISNNTQRRLYVDRYGYEFVLMTNKNFFWQTVMLIVGLFVAKQTTDRVTKYFWKCNFVSYFAVTLRTFELNFNDACSYLTWKRCLLHRILMFEVQDLFYFRVNNLSSPPGWPRRPDRTGLACQGVGLVS